MNLKSTFAGALALAPFLSLGQTVLTFSDQKRFRQIGPRVSEFEGGRLSVNVTDGSVTIAPCLGNGGALRSLPNPFCQLGTQGLITFGDFDGDGVRDNGLYFSIAQIQTATRIESRMPEKVSLNAAPSSELERPVTVGWVDDSTEIFFDQVNFPVRNQKITRYIFNREFAENQYQQQLAQVVPGVYQFNFPGLRINPQTPAIDQTIQVTHQDMIEPWPGGRSVVPNANHFTLLNDDLWNNEAMEVDPRVISTFEWRGFNPSTTFISDTLTFSMVLRNERDVTVQTPDGPVVVTQPPGTVVFPPYGALVPDAERFPEVISDTATFYELGPIFFQVGDELNAQLIFSRNFLSNGISFDTSQRIFTWDVNFVDTYDGYILDTVNPIFPDNSADVLILPTADFDGDGYNNITEFGLQTDPADPASVPVLTPQIDSITEQCVFTIPKRPLVGNRLKYEVEYTTDLQTWTVIRANDPNWLILQDSDQVYEVISRRPVPATTCLVRVRITQN